MEKTSKPITEDDFQLDAAVRIVCLRCGVNNQDDNTRFDPNISDFDRFIAEVVEDANKAGWKVIDGLCSCAKCVTGVITDDS